MSTTLAVKPLSEMSDQELADHQNMISEEMSARREQAISRRTGLLIEWMGSVPQFAYLNKPMTTLNGDVLEIEVDLYDSVEAAKIKHWLGQDEEPGQEG